MNNKMMVGLLVGLVVVVGVVVLMKKVEATVTESEVGFSPQMVTVKKGTTVVFMNKSGAVGNVTSAKHPTHLLYPKLSLGDMEDGMSLSLRFDDIGSFGYHDHLNPSRFGKITVEE